ncbi:hypothetical protein PMAYCL1PPCAC_13972 [Pristionchus mayeri]|uniref:Uncharacterized protein n=1 Tax=Pristionchus mayeri TaxID=1317129 RepID=A0AAN4ZM16_9BILA|nr:hypothetical protein PMAYCL1PPCAC_13972 [Pristionchus mayeri]
MAPTGDISTTPEHEFICTPSPLPMPLLVKNQSMNTIEVTITVPYNLSMVSQNPFTLYRHDQRISYIMCMIDSVLPSEIVIEWKNIDGDGTIRRKTLEVVYI